MFREQFKTLNDVFDLYTEKTLFKLQSEGYFEGIESPINLGKEGNVFTAITKEKKRVIIKIYRLSVCDYNKMYYNLAQDPRYSGVQNNRRKIIFSWAHREYRNLLISRAAGVRVPTAYAYKNNVLIMEYIGDDAGPAPKLNALKPKDPKKFYAETLKQIKLINKAGLIHGDLSAFNILNYREKPVIIDMSQATPFDNPHAKEYQERDIKNVNSYFKKIGVKINQSL